jgi:hypothetical protein
MLERWRAGEFAVPAWLTRASLCCLALAGVATGAAVLLFSGAVQARVPVRFPELLPWAWVGLVLCAGAEAGWWMLARGRRGGVLAAVAVASVAFAACLAGGAVAAINGHKASRPLAEALPADHEYREVRLGACHFNRPSLVFYCRREVRRVDDEPEALAFLAEPLPSYLFVREARWRQLEAKAPPGVRVLGRYPDLYRNGDPVLVVTNAAGESIRLAAK